MDKEKIKTAIELLLAGIGEDTERSGVKNTPGRFADFCEEIFYGYAPPPPVKTFVEESNSSAITIDGIKFTSFCEHHLVPFFGEISVSYEPDNNKICGFNDILKVCNHFSARLQIQERLTRDIGEYLYENLSPKKIRVEIKAEHFCMKLHEPRKESGVITTLFEK